MKLPGIRCRRKKPFILYHWSPVSRRASILKHGLKIGQKHAAHSPGWKATYLCFSDCPWLGWHLSGDFVGKGKWDLWCLWSDNVKDLCIRDDHTKQLAAEYRTNHNIKPKYLWRVATR